MNDTDTGSIEPTDRDALLSAILSELARELYRDHDDLQATLDGICNTATATIPGTQHAGILMLDARGRIRPRAPTDDLPARIDRLQMSAGEGPCVSAAEGEDVVRVPDMKTEKRWPAFSPAAAAEGVGSMLSFQLWVEGEHLGALNLFADNPNMFDESSERVGAPLAGHASVAIAGARRESQLRDALHSRDVIGQAKGMLMQRYSISADDAFALLTRLSQERNVKVREVAGRLIETGLD